MIRIHSFITAALLLLASWSAIGGCVEDLRSKTSVYGPVKTHQIAAVLQTWCTLSDQDASSLDSVALNPDVTNSAFVRNWIGDTELQLGGIAITNPEAMQFIIAHEFAHKQLNHSWKRLNLGFAVHVLAMAFILAPIIFWCIKKETLVIPSMAIILAAHVLLSLYEYRSYIENEHEADIQGMRLLAKHGYSAESAATAFTSALDEGEPSFLNSYFRWPFWESIKTRNPHPSMASRKARIEAEVRSWHRQ